MLKIEDEIDVVEEVLELRSIVEGFALFCCVRKRTLPEDF